MGCCCSRRSKDPSLGKEPLISASDLRGNNDFDDHVATAPSQSFVSRYSSSETLTLPSHASAGARPAAEPAAWSGPVAEPETATNLALGAENEPVAEPRPAPQPHSPVLIAVDVDGTLLNSAHELVPSAEAALVQARDAGVHIVIATGKGPGPWSQSHANGSMVFW